MWRAASDPRVTPEGAPVLVEIFLPKAAAFLCLTPTNP